MNSSARTRCLNIPKKFELTLHTVKMQISSRIDLQLFCQVNDSEVVASHVRRVEQTERIASFAEEKITIDLAPLKGRTIDPNKSLNDSYAP